MPHPVVFSEVNGKDGQRLRQFYAQLFGWSFGVVDGPMDYGVAETGDGGIGIGVGTAAGGGAGHVTFYVKTDNVPESLARAEALGGTTVMAPVDMPDGSVVGMFADPEGHRIGLHNPR
jgi:predicted enzyme related to lactoylglutathione lyase